MDGLLFDTEKMGFKAMKRAMKKEGKPFSINTYRKLIGVGYAEKKCIFKKIYGNEFPLNAVLSLFKLEFDNIVKKENVRVMTGVHEILDDLSKQDIIKCIASSSSLSTIQKYLHLTKMTHFFDFYVSSEEVERGKPFPDVFIEACKRANVDIDKSLVLEDSLHGMKSANRAEIKCVVIPDLIEPNDEMKNNAFHITDSLLNLVGTIKKHSSGV